MVISEIFSGWFGCSNSENLEDSKKALCAAKFSLKVSLKLELGEYDFLIITDNVVPVIYIFAFFKCSSYYI